MANAIAPVVLDLPTPLTRRRKRRRLVAAVALCIVTAAAGLVLRQALRHSNGPPPVALAAPFVHMAPVVVAEPSLPTPLPIHVGPGELARKGGWLTILGLPPLAGLSEGRAIAPGAWRVSLDRLPHLVITAPSGEGLRSRLALSLTSPEGTVLAESQSLLVVMPASQFTLPRIELVAVERPEVEAVACPEMAGDRQAGSGEASASVSRHELKLRAQRFVALGDGWFASGNIAAARNFYQHAMELGSAAGAFALATTYDPHELPRGRLSGIAPDLQKARCSYQRARDLAQAEASYYLKRLEPRHSTQVRHAENAAPFRPAGGP